MIMYWTMFGLPALFAVAGGTTRRALNTLDKFGLVFIFFLFTLLIGLRYEVGADWFTYQIILFQMSLEDLATATSYGDPAFSLVAWTAIQMGAETYGANLVCGLILVIGLIRFCGLRDNVWLALTAAVPYLVIVVGMGYVRQGAAIGFILVALASFERGNFARSIGWIFMAGLFHATAVMMAPLIGLAIVRKRPILLVPGMVVSAGLFVILLQSRLDTFYANYVEAEYDSSGAMIRLLMNAVPSILFLRYRKSFPGSVQFKDLFFILSILSLLLIPAVAVSPSTTLVDRIALYLIPIQIFVFGSLAMAMGVGNQGRFVVSVLTVGYYAAILFVWLNFATHSEYWLPYRFLPFE